MILLSNDGGNPMGIKSNIAPNRKWAAEAGLTESVLRTLYAEMPDRDIAVRYGVSDAIISYYRRKWGIPTVTARQRADKHRVGLPSLDDMTPSMLIGLYSQMGDQQIAKMYGVAKPAIVRLRRRWGIETLSKSDRSSSAPLNLTDEQKEICIGTLLGDGHLLERGVLKVTHSQAQLAYLRRMHALLAPLSQPIYYEEKRMEDSGNLAYAFGFTTKQHPWLASLRGMFYGSGRKTFPSSILESLAPRSLAYWYWDDGHLDSGLPSIAIGAFTDAEAQEIARLVGGRFGLDVYVKPSSSATCKSLGVRARSADVFFYLVRDCATPDLLYKLPQKHWPAGMVPRVSPPTKELLALPDDLLQRCHGWKESDAETREALLSDLVTHWHAKGFPHQEPRSEEITVIHALDPSQVIQNGIVKNRQAGQATCHAFSSHIWKATSHGSKQSPDDIFHEPERLSQALRLCLDGGRVPNGAGLRGSLRLLRRSGVYNFRPSAAKALVDRYCIPGGTVWDPCAGYGGRLFGAVLSSSIPRYVACEPQGETFTRLHHLRDWIDSYVPGVAARVELHRVPAEEFEPPDGVAMVMTSPPYWRREVYGDEPTQSGVRYTTYDAWLEGFWEVVLGKAVRALRPGGWLVLNVDNFKLGGVDYDLVGDTTRAVQALGFGEPEVLRYAMPYPGAMDNVEYVLCWPKPGVVGHVGVVGRFEVSTCSSCGKPNPTNQLVDGQCRGCRSPKGTTVECEGCGKLFVALRTSTRFHNAACYARFQRRKRREMTPAKTTRVFTCLTCGGAWETSQHGNFRTCPPCREKADVAGRTKVCGYRSCGQSFVDTSPKNGMSYCCEEHRRREKLYRSGVAKDDSYFRS